jgi:SAM-dependent methyltransferase
MTSPLSKADLFWQAVGEEPSEPDHGDDERVMADISRSPTYGEMKASLRALEEPSPTLLEWLEKTPSKGFALDLGSGTGCNALELLSRGWKVLCIDKHPMAMKTLESRVSRYIEEKKAILSRTDITECRPPKDSYHLVLCINTLSYIKPLKLKALMEKIFSATKPGGFFIGNLYILTSDRVGLFEDINFKMGAHAYRGPNFTKNLLEYSGFRLVSCIPTPSFSPHSRVVAFIAQKPALSS